MKKHYTKKQITEAIKYWESVLKGMDENGLQAIVLLEGKAIGSKAYGPYGQRLKEIVKAKQTWWDPRELDAVAQFLGYADADDAQQKNPSMQVNLKSLLAMAHQREKAAHQEQQKKQQAMKFNASTGNAPARAGRIRRDDQYLTPEEDAVKIIEAYKPFLAGKKILCNCDDPRESQVFKAFVKHFQSLGIVSATAIGMPPGYEAGKQAYMQTVSKDGLGELVPVSNGGDFRVGESQELLKKCDVVVSNPPFSNKMFTQFIQSVLKAGKDVIAIGPLFGAGYAGLQSYVTTGKLFVVKAPFQTFNRPGAKSGEQLELDALTGKVDDRDAPVALFSTFKHDAFGTPLSFRAGTTADLPLVYIDEYGSYFPVAVDKSGKFTIVGSVPKEARDGSKADADNYNYIVCPLAVLRKQWLDVFDIEAFPRKVALDGKELFSPVLMHYK